MPTVDFLGSFGDDLTVVNAARVSYAKQHAVFDESDSRLLAYLARNGHWSPFSHPQASFRIAANIAVARQLFRHQVGLTVNETSRRYVSDPPMFDMPDVWRYAPGAGQSKQGSGAPIADQRGAGQIVEDVLTHCLTAYETLISNRVAPEQARLLLPMGMATEWIWTGSLYAFARVCRERLASDAQPETQEVAQAIAEHMAQAFPVSWQALLGD